MNDGVQIPFGRVLVILVGPSGAGKSTLARAHFPEREIVSSDNLRHELLGNFQRQDKNKEIFAEFHRRIDWRLRNGQRAVADATHLVNKDRKEVLAIGRANHAKIFYVVVNRSLDEKKETGGWRNSAIVRGKSLIEAHDERYQSNRERILAGDFHKDVSVVDASKQSFFVVEPVWSSSQ